MRKMLTNIRDMVCLLICLAVATLMARWLMQRGWPLISWLPASILTFLGVGLLWILLWYVRRKSTYQRLAQRTKADLQAGGNGWPE